MKESKSKLYTCCFGNLFQKSRSTSNFYEKKEKERFVDDGKSKKKVPPDFAEVGEKCSAPTREQYSSSAQARTKSSKLDACPSRDDDPPPYSPSAAKENEPLKHNVALSEDVVNQPTSAAGNALPRREKNPARRNYQQPQLQDVGRPQLVRQRRQVLQQVQLPSNYKPIHIFDPNTGITYRRGRLLGKVRYLFLLNKWKIIPKYSTVKIK